MSEGSVRPKYRPVTVTEPPPVRARLPNTPVDAIGASNVNNCDAVPTIPPTVTSSQTLPGLSASLFSGVAQRIVVVVLQLAVGQIAALIPAVSVCCPVPKLRPVKLTIVPPLLAQLKDEPALDTTGASKVKIGSDVPVIPSTLATRMPGVLPSGKNPAQFAKVVDVHETVEQPPPCNTADIVGSFTSKLIPATVTDMPPDVSMLWWYAALEVGASNTRGLACVAVPLLPATFTEYCAETTPRPNVGW